MELQDDDPVEQNRRAMEKSALRNDRADRRARRASTYQTQALSPEQWAVVQKAIADTPGQKEGLGLASGWNEALGGKTLDKEYDTPEQAKAAAAEWAKGLDTQQLYAEARKSSEQNVKDWQAGQHDDSFFGMNPGTLAAGMALAAGGSMLMGGWAAPAAATGKASGLAGTLGMQSGTAATALNAGAINTGVSLARGSNIGDALKSGATAALLSPVGGWAKGAIGSVLPEGMGAVATVGAGAVTGAAGAALTGKDIAKGAMTGAISGAVSEAGKLTGNYVKDATDSELAGKAASAVTSTALKGGNLRDAAGSLAGSYAGSYTKNATGSDALANASANAANDLVANKKKGIVAGAVSGAVDDFSNGFDKFLGWTKAPGG